MVPLTPLTHDSDEAVEARVFARFGASRADVDAAVAAIGVEPPPPEDDEWFCGLDPEMYEGLVRRVAKAFAEVRREALEQAAKVVDELLAEAEDTPVGLSLVVGKGAAMAAFSTAASSIRALSPAERGKP